MPVRRAGARRALGRLGRRAVPAGRGSAPQAATGTAAEDRRSGVIWTSGGLPGPAGRPDTYRIPRNTSPPPPPGGALASTWPGGRIPPGHSPDNEVGSLLCITTKLSL